MFPFDVICVRCRDKDAVQRARLATAREFGGVNKADDAKLSGCRSGLGKARASSDVEVASELPRPR